MTKPLASCRRIDRLKAIAFDCGFTNRRRQTVRQAQQNCYMEALLETYGIPRRL
jgi:hypothetical protein